MTLVYLSTSGQMGGAESALLALLEALSAQQPAWRLTLILGEDGPLALQAARAGVTVRILPVPPALARIGARSRLWRVGPSRASRSVLGLIGYRRQLVRLLQACQPDVVHSNGLKMHFLLASMSRRALGRRCVRVCHLHDGIGNRPTATRLFRLFGRRFHRIVSSSESVAHEVRALPVDVRRVCSINNGVSLDRFAPEGICADLDEMSGMPEAQAGTVRIALVASFAKWKGHPVFMRALARLPPGIAVRAYVIGGAIYRSDDSQYTMNELQLAAHELCPHIQIGFTGVVACMQEVYRAVDVVVHASVQPEPFGMVVIEAMACGRAVIASRGGGVSEIVDDGVNGMLHEAGDDASLALGIERLVRDPGQRVRLGQAGLLTVRSRFDANLMAARFSSLYELLLDETTPRSGVAEP